MRSTGCPACCRHAGPARTATTLALPTGDEHVVVGRLVGSLIREPRGTGGFGYDPAFVPEGEWRTTAEMSAEEKNAISHRGNAFRALAPAIQQMVQPPA